MHVRQSDKMPGNARERLTSRIGSGKAVWVFCGDSITHGAAHTNGRRDYVELIEERVRGELGKTLHLFVNSGISGNTTRDILAQLDHRVLRFRPDIFSLMIGMNDCAANREMSVDEFAVNLRSIIAKVRESATAEVLLQTTCAIDPAETPERVRFLECMEAIREAATELDTALIDHQVEWEKTRRDEPARYASWMANPFHPNALGHWVFAERILRDLGLGALEQCAPPRDVA